MSTSIQQQLAVIAANSTHQLDTKAQKARHSKSLLYEPRDAANQSFDTIFQICFEGFQELCQLDNRFLPFGRTLFSEQSKNEWRTQMTAEENENLDKAIVSFLGLLGSRLLVKPGMRAAEWLVRKFEVHEHNTEALIMTFLPHHDTDAFPALLAILPDRLPANFIFLHPYITTFQNPPQQVIVSAAINNPAFFTSFSQFVLSIAKAKHHSAYLLSFWARFAAQVVYGMIDQKQSGREAIRKQNEEDILLRVIPILQSAFLTRGISDLYSAACMIMSILISRIQPAETVIDASMKAVVHGWNTQTFESGLSCIAILAEEKQKVRLPKSISSAIIKHEDSSSVLKRIASYTQVNRLIAGLALASIDRIATANDFEASQFLLAMPHPESLPETYVHPILESTMSILNSQDGSEQQNTSSETLQTFLQTFLSQPGYARAIKRAAETTGFQSSQLLLSAIGGVNKGEDTTGEVEQSDAMELDSKSADIVKDSSFSLDTLPLVIGKDYSFVDPEKQYDARPFTDAFRLCFEDANILASFMNHMSLKKSTPLESANFLSFLAHIWTSNAAAAEKQKALNVARETMNVIAKPAAIDMQGMFPYVISALSDSSKAVRAEARAFCISLTTLRNSKKGSTQSNNAKVWGKDSLYGSVSDHIKWLSTEDSDILLKKLLSPILEDCVVDQQHAVAALAGLLNASAESKDEGRPALELSSRTAICDTLVSHALLTPTIPVKLRFLDMLSKLGKVGDPARTTLVVPYIQSSNLVLEDNFASSPIIKVSKALIKCLSHRSRDELELLKSLALTKLDATAELVPVAFNRIARLFKVMKGIAKTELFDWLLQTCVDDQLSDPTRTSAIETLRGISLSTGELVHAVESLPSVFEIQDQPKPAKKQRNSRDSDTWRVGSVQRTNLTNALKRITLVLELVEASKPENHPQLLGGLFHLLGGMHQYRIAAGSDLVYLYGLLIGILQAVVDGLTRNNVANIDRSVVRPEQIVDCARTTSSTQVHNAALLLMSSLASWAPERVMHDVMPLFTFMGSTILKQGDDYSAHVAERAITCIIPPLVASLRRNGKDLISGAADLMFSFTAVFEHMPQIRRAGVFEHLVRTLGADESLFAIIAMLIDRYQPNPTITAFVTNLIGKFSIATQFQTLRRYLDLIFDALKPRRSLSDIILGGKDKTAAEIKLAAAALQTGLSNAMVTDALRHQLSRELFKDEPAAEALRVAYSELLERAMQLTLQTKDDKILHPGAEKILSSLLRLMSTKDFIDASAKLMQTGTHDIRQQVFASLENRVTAAKRGDANLQEVFIGVIPNCSVFVASSQPVATRHAAIACIDQIAEKYGKTDRTAIAEAARLVAGNDALGSEDPSLRTISLLCLATMVEVIEDEFVAIIPTALQKALDSLETLLSHDTPDLPLYRACFSLVSAILDHLPWALSGQYLDQFLKFAATSAERTVEMADVTRKFCLLAANKLKAGESFGAVDRTWAYAVQQGSQAARQHLQMVEATIKHNSKSTITTNSTVLFSIIQAAFNLRVALPETQTADVLKSQELYSFVDEVALEAILKLNDATFRPFFMRLVDWANEEGAGKSSSQRYLRCISLFSFSFTLFEQLKSLVTSYASFLLETVTEILKDRSPDDEVKSSLLKLVLQTIASSFHHDEDDFWQAPAHFDAVAEPLLAQLKSANTIAVEQNLIPAITDLAAAAGGSLEHYKTLNGILMGYMRHQDSAVRLAAVKCERDITTRLNLDWLTLLPEMLPFISELQEDDDEAVERETLRWVKQIEEVTGESLEGMLV